MSLKCSILGNDKYKSESKSIKCAANKKAKQTLNEHNLEQELIKLQKKFDITIRPKKKKEKGNG